MLVTRLSLDCLLSLALAASPPAHAADAASADEKLLSEHKPPTDGPGLLNYFKKRGSEDLSDAKLKQLVEQLGADDFFEREQASKALLLAGPRASAALTAALKHSDLEVRHRAGRCLEGITKSASASSEVVRAAVRVLALRQPDGAVAALLGHLDRSENAAVTEDVK